MNQAALTDRMTSMVWSESLEGLRQIRAALTTTDAGTVPGEAVDAIYRVWHTMRGSAAMTGLDALAALAGVIEAHWALLRQRTATPDATTRTLTLATADWLEGSMSGPDPGNPVLAVAFLEWTERWRGLRPYPDAAGDGGHDEGSAARESEGTTQRLWLVSFSPGPGLMRRGVDVLGLLDELTSLGDTAVRVLDDDLPTLDRIEPDRAYLNWHLLLCGPIERTTLEDVFIFVAADSAISMHCLADPLPDHWRWDAGCAQDALLAHADPDAAALRSSLGLDDPAGGPLRSQPAEAAGVPGSVSVPRARLDRQIDLVGELVIAQSALLQIARGRSDPVLTGAVERVIRLAAEMRDSAIQLRMVPASRLFRRIEGEVESLNARYDTLMRVRCEGSAYELDQRVLDLLLGPLLAIATTLGCFESPDRTPNAGRLGLSLDRSGHSTLLRVTFDRPGATPTMLEHLREPANRLRAELDVDPAAAASAICMRLPLSQDIIDGLLIEVRGQSFVVPLALVIEVVDLATVRRASRHGQDILNLRGALVPFVRLSDLFSLDAASADSRARGADSGESGQVIISGADGGRSAGLLVDRVVGQQQVFVKPVPALFDSLDGVAGATILGDGSVALILDLNGLLDRTAGYQRG